MTDAPGEDYERLEEAVDYLQVEVMEIDTLKRNVALSGEALALVHGILLDLVKEASEDPTEYADDLERLDQIASLLA